MSTSHTNHSKSLVNPLTPVRHTKHVTTYLKPLPSTSTTTNRKERTSIKKPTNYRKNTKQVSRFKPLLAANNRIYKKRVISHKEPLLRKFNTQTKSGQFKTDVKPVSQKFNKRREKKQYKTRIRPVSSIYIAKSKRVHSTSHNNPLLSTVRNGHEKGIKRWPNTVVKENTKSPSDYEKNPKTNRNPVVPPKNKYKLISGRAKKLKPLTTPELTDSYYSGSSTEEEW